MISNTSNMNAIRMLLITAVLAFGPAVFARSGSSGGHRSSSAHVSSHVSSRSGHGKCLFCARDTHGRIKRSSQAKKDFQKSHPCPSTGATSGGCRGYVIDHITPLKRGGADAPSNMQWQTTADAKAKDKVE